MEVSVLIPTALRTFTDRKSEIKVEGNTVGEVISNFVKTYPDIKQHLYNADDTLRSFINIYVGEKNIKNLKGLDTQVVESDSIILVPAIAGGC